MTTDFSAPLDTAAYQSLGLIGNPFRQNAKGTNVGARLEIQAAAHRLLKAIVATGGSAGTPPIVVEKTLDVPASYHLRAISLVESTLINDESLSTLHAYVQLFMMRSGRVRSTLASLSERLVFREVERTLIDYIERVLAQPDIEIASYQVLGPEALAAFSECFAADPLVTFRDYFGEEELERVPDLAEVADLRLVELDVDQEETDTGAELDSDVPDAPGTGMLMPAGREDAEDRQPIIDYLLEYIATHLSPVVARSLRVYRERGLAAAAMELRITKAPRKTLAAVARLAGARFERTALIYDGFDSWVNIPPEMRESIVETMTQLQQVLDGLATFVFLLEREQVPELEAAFGTGAQVMWDFPWLVAVQKDPDTLDSQMLDDWMAAAALAPASSWNSAQPMVAALIAEADGSLARFAPMAAAAIDDAAARGVEALDDAAFAAGRAALVESAAEAEQAQ